MTRERDPERPSEPLAGTTVWHDYDGDAIYGDLAILGASGSPPQFVTAETFSHEPGVGQFDVEQTSLAFYHGDQIGSLRAITGDESAGQGGTGVPPVLSRVVYTAFGEPVYSGSVGVPPAPGGVGTRYQYAGAWGYQSDLYPAAGPYGAGSPGDFTSAVPFLHVGHRWYDPSTGRFIQRDPIGIRGGLNVHLYVEAIPTMALDGYGMATIYWFDGGPPRPGQPRTWGDNIGDFIAWVYSPITNNQDKISNAVACGVQVVYVDTHQAAANLVTWGYCPDFTHNMVYEMSAYAHRVSVKTSEWIIKLLIAKKAKR